MRAVIVMPLLALLAACGESHPVPVARMPDPALLVRCETPPIPDANPTRAQVDSDWVASVQIALICAAKFDALADFVEAGKK